MKKNSIIIKTDQDGQDTYWTTGFDFSSFAQFATWVTSNNAKEIAHLCAEKYPGQGIQVIRNFGTSRATGLMF